MEIHAYWARRDHDSRYAKHKLRQRFLDFDGAIEWSIYAGRRLRGKSGSVG